MGKRSKNSRPEPVNGPVEVIDVEKLRDKDPVLKDMFWEIVRGARGPHELNEVEIRALIVRVGYLSDDERARFAPVLTRENLTDKDVDRYGKLQTLDRYFPVGKD